MTAIKYSINTLTFFVNFSRIKKNRQFSSFYC
nr:MAG TPA: hypothetical protein [Caudoviricetes sp.]